ncbi:MULTISPECIES: hypothetical protein [Microbacterium]|uniref:hypothetical protein n=1 Tax=Microbacterium TaxID=33882 RepID=UPI00146A8B26|nr:MULTISPECIES: hypothetical protein [Microbacterium]
MIQYISAAIPAYCRPEPSYPGEHFGRGERTRFVSFGLEGLTTYPEVLFGSDVAMETVRFSLRFLSESQFQGGWPETRGEAPDSIHQTARAICSLVRLLLADQTHGGLATEEQEVALELALAGGARLLSLQLDDGSWPVRPTTGNERSAAKTALATMSLGYLAHLSANPEITHAREDGGRWLMANMRAWDGRTEEDVDEKGTHWVHMAYAECVRGVLAGYPEPPRQLKSVFDRLSRRWSVDERLWTEPGKPEGKATIRAAYHTVMAFEAARPDSVLVAPKPLPAPEEPRLGQIRGIRINERTIEVLGTKAHAEMALSPGPMVTLLALHQMGGRATTQELADATGKQVSSIHQDVKLINSSAVTASFDAVPHVVLSVQEQRRYVYELIAPIVDD